MKDYADKTGKRVFVVRQSKQGALRVYFEGNISVGDLLLKEDRYVFQPTLLCPVSLEAARGLVSALEQLNEGLK